MKTVYLLRHAKSSWEDPALEDFDRPLAPRGRKAAPRMAAFMREKGLIPEIVLCSAARRALETWEQVAPGLDAEIPVKVLSGLYHAAPSGLLAALRRAPADAASALLVGHNPAIEGLALLLCGPRSKPKALDRLRAKFPTGALAVIDVEADTWSALAEGSGRLTQFVCPRDLS